MEMTTVSPASPTEGDDLCEIDGTSVAIHSVTLLISLCGLVGNGAVLRLLSLKDHNSGIFDLACADFFFLLFTVPTALLFLVEDVSCSPIMPLLYLNFLFQLSVVSYYWVLIQLMFSSNNSNMYKLCMLWCRCHLPDCLLWLVFSVQYRALIALIALFPTVTFMWLSHEQGHSQAALISMYTVILVLFAAPVTIAITTRFIKSMKKQQPKRRNIILFLLVLFILLLIICNFLQQLGYIVVSSEVVFLLNCIHSSIKPFIYFLAGRCWSPCSPGSLWLSLRRVFDEQEEAAQNNDAPMDTEV